jgi:MoaA/NifB/PqqE/SkfB family radical SAM enzyme
MIQNINSWPLAHWHIELCSKCSLQCPRCSRQEVPEGLTNRELTLDWFKKNFSSFITEAKKITFCGDDGDPIYARELIPIISWMKQQNPDIQIVIVTNGSYKTIEWWASLTNILSANDHIHFSIDGWDQASNDLYRVNSNWVSIIDGIKTVKSFEDSPIVTWATIVFRFNEDKIQNIKSIAKFYGCDYFQTTLSSKFNINYSAYPNNDELQPTDSSNISQGRFTRTTESLSDRTWTDRGIAQYEPKYNVMAENLNIKPLCWVGNKGLYINAEGKFYPCCWTGLRYAHNRNIFNYIDYTQNFESVVNDPNWQKLFNSFTDGSCPNECREKCSANKWSYAHATEW